MTGKSLNNPNPALSPLVDKAKGLQPLRRLLHAASGATIVLALTLFPGQQPAILLILGGLFGLLLFADVTRLFIPDLNLLFFRAFQPFVSPREARRFASSTWYAASALLVLHLFPLEYALAGILVLAVADPAAAVFGWNWGKRPFGTGTALGSGTFMAVAFPAILIFVPWWAALVTAVLAGLVEASPLPLDDNLTLPLVVAGALALMGA